MYIECNGGILSGGILSRGILSGGFCSGFFPGDFVLEPEEVPEHLSQLGDMSIYCHEPLWTVDNTKDTEIDYVK